MCVLAWLMWCGAGEEEDEDDDDEEGEAEEERMRSGEEEQHVESLRKFRTQQAIRNLLLEREVKILQVRSREGRERGREGPGHACPFGRVGVRGMGCCYSSHTDVIGRRSRPCR